jgi:hypothetical protein
MAAIVFAAYWTQQPVTLPGNSLNVTWALPAVAENRSQTIYQDVNAVFEFHVAVWPEPALYLFASNQLARALYQKRKQIEGLSGKPHPLSASAEFPQTIVKLKVTEGPDHCGSFRS